MFKKLRTVIYHVEDLDDAKNWYKNITGIDPYFDQLRNQCPVISGPCDIDTKNYINTLYLYI